ILRGLRALFHRSAADRDIDDEVQQYLDEATAAHVARGLPSEEARRAARIELGGTASVTEQVRSYGWENVVRSAVTDLRYAGPRPGIGPPRPAAGGRGRPSGPSSSSRGRWASAPRRRSSAR